MKAIMVKELLDNFLKNPKDIPEDVLDLYPATIAEALADVEYELVEDVLDNLPKELSSEVFAQLKPEVQELYAEELSSKDLAGLLVIMQSDDRANLARRLIKPKLNAALKLLSKEDREDILKLSAYPTGTVGAIMTSEYAYLPGNITASQAIDMLREEAAQAETILISFVVNKAKKLLGTLTLQEIILAEPNTKIHEFLNTDLVTIKDTDDQETAAEIIAQYDILAIPVLNEQDKLVGIVTHDDVIDVLNQEHTEDMEKLMGITGKHEDMAYLRTPVLSHFKNRIGWILGLAILGFVSGFVLKGFESVLANLMVLSLFMPMLADTGGNMGSQSATVVIRALALKEITLRDAGKVLFKEIRISLMSGVILASVAFVRVLLLAGDSTIPDGISLYALGGVIALALGLQVVSSAIIGCLLPMGAEKLKLDPAVVASPAITTVVDITGILIYFSLASKILGV